VTAWYARRSGAQARAEADKRKDQTMRKAMLIFPLVLILCCPSAYSRNKEVVEPLQFFMAPDFQFKQIDTICLAPTLDLRSDKTAEFSLSEEGPKVDFSRVPTADQARGVPTV
jgi:hypothetical protein